MRRSLVWLLACAGCLVEYTVGAPAGEDGGCPEGQEPCGDGCAAAGECDDDECPGGQIRCDGACVAASACDDEGCPEGQVECGGTCVAADTCPCEEGCDKGHEVCEAGLCVCREGLMRCGAVCVDTRADPQHCGSCEGVCAGSQGLCQAADCVAGCAGTRRACNGACVDTDSDPLHCGRCGEACESDEVCVAGDCRRYTALPGCMACPCDDACGGDDEEDVCCEVPFLGAPACVDDGCG